MLRRTFARQISMLSSHDEGLDMLTGGIGAIPGAEKRSSNGWLWIAGLAAFAIVGIVGMTWWQKQKAIEEGRFSDLDPADLDELRDSRKELVNKENRLRDKLAQRDPEWAIENNEEAFGSGRHNSAKILEATDWIAAQTKAGKKVVIHGRDGDVFYQLLKRKPKSEVDMSKISYVISSRPLTTEHPFEKRHNYHSGGSDETRPRDPAYDHYLRRTVPRGAIHVDTGYAGSIPTWMDTFLQRGPTTKPIEKGGYVAETKMISSTTGDDKHIPMKTVRSTSARNELVETIENSPLRMKSMSTDKPWGRGGARYSERAPGFWAFLYGVEAGKQKGPMIGKSLAEIERAQKMGNWTSKTNADGSVEMEEIDPNFDYTARPTRPEYVPTPVSAEKKAKLDAIKAKMAIKKANPFYVKMSRAGEAWDDALAEYEATSWSDRRAKEAAAAKEHAAKMGYEEANVAYKASLKAKKASTIATFADYIKSDPGTYTPPVDIFDVGHAPRSDAYFEKKNKEIEREMYNPDAYGPGTDKTIKAWANQSYTPTPLEDFEF